MHWLLLTQRYLRLQVSPFAGGLRNASWSSQAVRSTFINYFQGQGHEYVPSSSVIPKKGEGTYFTNAGMNQFKPIFLGELDPTSKFRTLSRAVNSQKCIRVGGKHNDLDDVGHDLTHHTFFEMLGSWSFGDYFKPEACAMALELLTKEFGLPLDRLYFTYFAGDESLKLPVDEECRQIWISLGVPKERVLPFGIKDNFWEMGLTGPCGPCSEIHYGHVGSRDAQAEVNAGSPSVVEIWNLVFMQHNRQGDQVLKPLPTFHVDTGMGLERMTAVLNGSADNYTTDLFLPMLQLIHKHSKCVPYRGNQSDLNTSYRMLADHVRMFTVAIGDGLLPRHDNLGHKLRTILHRCIHLCQDVFHVQADVMLPELVSLVVQSLGPTYPDLQQKEHKICEVVKASIDHHNMNREQAIKSFNKMLSKSMQSKQLSGEVILALEKGFYGSPLPMDMIVQQAHDHGLSLDMEGYHRLIEKRQAEVSTAPLTVSANIATPLVNAMLSQHTPVTQDHFKYAYHPYGDSLYDFGSMCEATQPCHIQGLSCQGQVVDQLSEGQPGELILDRTCFYAESGGQESDLGQLISQTGEFNVTDVQYVRGYIVHYGQVSKGSVQFGQCVEPRLTQVTRQGCMRNHTATHILNAALTDVLPNAQQEGSSVSPYKFTFDFLALSSIQTAHIQRVEKDVRDIIKQECPVSRRVIPLEEALQLKDIKYLQNEDYPEMVSVITVGWEEDGGAIISQELCGGTHVYDTSHLTEFCITHLTTKSQSVRRMTCVTGQEAEQAHVNGQLMQAICQLLSSLVNSKDITADDVGRLKALLSQVKSHLEARQERLTHQLTTVGVRADREAGRLKDLLEENSKAQSWCQAVSQSLGQLLTQTDKHTESLMKDLLLYIRKGCQLELLPKTMRDLATDTLESLEHRVSQALNKKGAQLLVKLIEGHTQTRPTTAATLTLSIDHIDMGHRQVIKLMSQQSWDHRLVLVHNSGKSTHIVASLPLSSAQPLSPGDVDQIAKGLSKWGKSKGKLATQNHKVCIYHVAVQGKTPNNTGLMELLHSQDIFGVR